MSKPKTVKPPPPPAPTAVPDTAPETEEQMMKKSRRASGYQKTLLTGALTPNTGKSTLLGGGY